MAAIRFTETNLIESIFSLVETTLFFRLINHKKREAAFNIMASFQKSSKRGTVNKKCTDAKNTAPKLN